MEAELDDFLDDATVEPEDDMPNELPADEAIICELPCGLSAELFNDGGLDCSLDGDNEEDSAERVEDACMDADAVELPVLGT